MTVKTKSGIEFDNSRLAMGIVLFDPLLFSMHFLSGDISEKPSVHQKLMFLDDSKRILICTGRFVLKTVRLIGRLMRDVATHPMPKHSDRIDEIRVRTPTEGHLSPLVDKLFSIMNNNILFRSLIKQSNKGDKPQIDTRTNLKVFFRIEGSSGTDTNMVGLHPIKDYADECAFGNTVSHRSCLVSLHPGGQTTYGGVPNNVRTSPFYALDQTKEGDTWSRHKFSMLEANPIIANDPQHQKRLENDFGGKNTPDYITQVEGKWGDEALSSFPPGAVAWGDFPYYVRVLAHKDVEAAVKQNSLHTVIKIPQVRCRSALIGWDYGYSPDPTTFLIAVQTGDDETWRTYARVQLYAVALPRQIEVLQYLWVTLLESKVAMLSVDSQPAYQIMLSEDNKHIFNERVKLTVQGGTVEMDTSTGYFVGVELRDEPEIQQKRKMGKIKPQGRKFFLTEMFRRYMINTLLNREGPRLLLGYDSALESELVGTIERKTSAGRIVYEVPRKGAGTGRVIPDQIVDAARALADCIVEVDRTDYTKPRDRSGLLEALGWVGSGNGRQWEPPYSRTRT